jgi:hypothetical protein
MLLMPRISSYGRRLLRDMSTVYTLCCDRGQNVSTVCELTAFITSTVPEKFTS